MLQTEKDFIDSIIRKGTTNREDKKQIYTLYQKYIDPQHTAPFIDSDCASCLSIVNMWRKIREFATKN